MKTFKIPGSQDKTCGLFCLPGILFFFNYIANKRPVAITPLS